MSEPDEHEIAWASPEDKHRALLDGMRYGTSFIEIRDGLFHWVDATTVEPSGPEARHELDSR